MICFHCLQCRKGGQWQFFGVLEGQFFLVKKEDMSSKRRAYGNPAYLSLNLVEDLQGRPFFFNNLL